MNYKDRLKRHNEDRKRRNRSATGSASYLTDPTNPASIYYQPGSYNTGSSSSSSECDSSSSGSSYDPGSSSSSSSDCGGGSYGE